jgi:hypothetical protein
LCGAEDWYRNLRSDMKKKHTSKTVTSSSSMNNSQNITANLNTSDQDNLKQPIYAASKKSDRNNNFITSVSVASNNHLEKNSTGVFGSSSNRFNGLPGGALNGGGVHSHFFNSAAASLPPPPPPLASSSSSGAPLTTNNPFGPNGCFRVVGSDVVRNETKKKVSVLPHGWTYVVEMQLLSSEAISLLEEELDDVLGKQPCVWYFIINIYMLELCIDDRILISFFFKISLSLSFFLFSSSFLYVIPICSLRPVCKNCFFLY